MKKSNIILVAFLAFLFISPIIIFIDIKANMKPGKLVSTHEDPHQRKVLGNFNYIYIDSNSAPVVLKTTDSNSYYFMDYGIDGKLTIKNDTLFINDQTNINNSCNLFAHSIKGIVINNSTLQISDWVHTGVVIEAINKSNIKLGNGDDTPQSSITNASILANNSTVTLSPHASFVNTSLKLTGQSNLIVKPDIDPKQLSITLTDSVNVEAPYEKLKKLNLLN